MIFPVPDTRNGVIYTSGDIYCAGSVERIIQSKYSSAIAWGTANLAKYVPFVVSQPTIVSQVMIFNGTISGNLDVGVYNGLSLAQLVSSGSTAHAGASAGQTITLTATTLPPGFYFLALAFDNATASIRQNSATNTQTVAFGGFREETTAFPLPATATLQYPTSIYLPFIALFPTHLGL